MTATTQEFRTGASTDGDRLRSPMERAVVRAPRWTVVFTDAACVAIGLSVPYALSAQAASGPTYLVDRQAYLVLMAAGIASFMAAFALQRLYTARFVARPVDELRRLVIGCVLGSGGMWGVAFMFKLDISRGWALVAPMLVFALVAIQRAAIRNLFARVRSGGHLLRSVILIGTNREATAIRDMLNNDSSLGYRVLDSIEIPRSGEGLTPTLADLERTARTIERSEAGGVLLAASALDLVSSNWLVRRLTDAGVHVELSSTLRDVASNRLTVRPLGQFPMIYVEPTIRDGWRATAKRSFDVVLATLLLVATSPILFLAAVAIKVTSRGPVVFRQERVGRNGKCFDVMKLRTMVVDAEKRLGDIAHLNEVDGPLFKVKADPRVTPVGRFLRKTSIDELPQLVNVLRGEMSLVGPRPALPREVEQWTGNLHERLRVQPGITGMWQVSGRSEASFDDYRRLDLYYVDNWSLATDLSILFRTLPVVMLRRGAH
jgi:exopolysaccharide biosynthesis polyprenyl glycosylphosphotransferase